MSGKCEHGLTTRECFVCASPKYGERKPDDTDVLVQRVMEAADRLAGCAWSKDNSRTDAARAELERVVRESLRPPGS